MGSFAGSLPDPWRPAANAANGKKALEFFSECKPRVSWRAKVPWGERVALLTCEENYLTRFKVSFAKHFTLPRFSQGVLPDLFALNVIAIAQNAGSRWSDAVEILHVVSRMSLEPTAQTLSPVMSACSQARVRPANSHLGGSKKARVMTVMRHGYPMTIHNKS